MDFAWYMRLPFADKGRGLDGVDCWGLVRLVLLREYGLRVPSYADSYLDAEDESAQAAIGLFSRDWLPVSAEGARNGDVIVFHVFGAPTHCGVIVSPGTFMHIFNKRGVACEEYVREPWRSRIEGIYRWPT